MSLEDRIAGQYGQRESRDVLYTGIYPQKAALERAAKIKELISRYKKTGDSILEVGAGHGDNVPMLLDCGYKENEIFLNEMLPPRIENIRKRYPQIELYEGDALKIEPRRTFGCVFQSTVFTSLLNDEDRRQLAARMWNLLHPGGIILWYDFVFNNPSNKDVRKVGREELSALFPLAGKSEWQRVTLAPPIGRRVGKLYGLFNIPFLRSHILAVFQKPY